MSQPNKKIADQNHATNLTYAPDSRSRNSVSPFPTTANFRRVPIRSSPPGGGGGGRGGGGVPVPLELLAPVGKSQPITCPGLTSVRPGRAERDSHRYNEDRQMGRTQPKAGQGKAVRLVGRKLSVRFGAIHKHWY